MAEESRLEKQGYVREPCQKFACAIQKCLAANNYDEDKCKDAKEAMKKCCSKLTTFSYICQGFNNEADKK